MTTARAAGLLYVLMGATGAFALQYVPRALVVPGDPAATADRLRDSEALFRLGLAAELISTITFIFTALVLYRLFQRVDRTLATLMVLFVLLSVPISLVNVLSEVVAMLLATGGNALSAFGRSELDTLAFVAMRLHSQGFALAEIFWGLWLMPLGILAMRSGFAPRVIGVLLIVAGSAYVVHAFTSFVLPQYASVVANIALLPEAGEISIVVWLLATRFGAASRPRLEVAAAPS